ENNQEICPSSLECPRYISDSKQYSLSESIEHIPNNVVNATEGKPAWQFHGRRGKGKRSKRKRGLKDEQQTPARRGHRKPEQESRAPIPVQDDEPQQSSMYLGSSWQIDGKEGFSFSPRHHDGTHDHPWPESQPLKDDYKSDLHKLISPSQCIYHVGAGKHPPSFSETPLPFDPTSRLPGVIKALGLNAPLDLGWGDLQSPEWGSPKLCSSSETRSVEEWTLVALRDSVSQGEPRNVSSLAKAWEDEKDVGDGVDNEGVLLIEVQLPEPLHRLPALSPRTPLLPWSFLFQLLLFFRI
ncbi:hypothetical protein FKM82_026369, partial [Ascaphus truei]